MSAMVPVKSLGTDGITAATSMAVCRIVPVAAICSAGIIAWRIHTGYIEGLSGTATATATALTFWVQLLEI